jgi:hypothetical protein
MIPAYSPTPDRSSPSASPTSSPAMPNVNDEIGRGAGRSLGKEGRDTYHRRVRNLLNACCAQGESIVISHGQSVLEAVWPEGGEERQ